MALQDPSEAPTGKPKRRWRRRLWRACEWLAVSLVALAIAGRFWIIPAVLRSQAHRAISRHWDGPVEIGDVAFSYFGPPAIRQIELRDNDGRVWVRVGSIRFSLRDWPGLHPVLTAIDVENLLLQAHFVGGKCDPPVRLGGMDRPSWLKEYVDLQRVVVSDASFARIEQGGRTLWKDVEFFLRRRGTGYSAWLDRRAEDGAHQWWVRGLVRPEADGAVRLTDCEISTAKNVITKNLGMLIRPWSEGRLDIRQIGADAFGGRIDAALYYAGAQQNRTADYGGQLAVRAADLGKLTQALGDDESASKGTLNLSYTFRGRGQWFDDLWGRGVLFVDDAEFGSVGILDAILLFLEIKEGELRGGTDVNAVFTTKGAIARIERARFANRLSAGDVEPGGTINLRTKHVDAYLVAGVFAKIGGLFGLPKLPKFPIPIIGTVAALTESLAAELVKRLTRLHVEGPWDEAKKVKITATPLKDLQEDTAQFMRDALRSSGQLGEGAVKLFKGIFEVLDPNAGRTGPATTRPAQK